MNVARFEYDTFKQGLVDDSPENEKYRSIRAAYERSVSLPLNEVTLEDLELLLIESEYLLNGVMFSRYNVAIFQKSYELKRGKCTLRNNRKRFL